MLEERARILSVEAHSVWVEANRQQGCAKCDAGQGCGGGMLNKLVRRKSSRLEVRCDLAGIQPGDSVVVGFDERALLHTSFMAYLLPLLGLFSGALLAERLLQANDLIVALAGLLGLVAGFIGFYHFSEKKRILEQYQPRVLRRLTELSPGCQVYLPETERDQ